MKKTILFVMTIVSCALIIGCQTIAPGEDTSKEKPIQHMKVADVTSSSEAKKVMKLTTSQLKSKKKLDAVELHEIHVITYSLEKAIAYYAENAIGAQKSTAEKMAVVVEEVHLNSENNRKAQTKAALTEYFALEKAFSKGL